MEWQWEQYPKAYRDRRNLLIHAATVPLFAAGVLLIVAAPWLGLWALVGGAALLPLVMSMQGRGHCLESAAPVPFAGPFDVMSRIFVEQLITFPRFVLSGEFVRAWRRAVKPTDPRSA